MTNKMLRTLLLCSAACFATPAQEKKLDDLWEALYQNPRSIELNKRIAALATEMKNHEEALFAYQRALALVDTDELHYKKGKTHQAMGGKRQAIEEYQWVIENSEDPKLIIECEHLLKRLTRKKRHSFHGALTVKYQLDSNATSGTSSEIPDPLNETVMQAPTGRSDHVKIVNALLSHRYETPIEHLFMKNSGMLAIKEYEKVDSLDVLILKLTTGLEYLCGTWIFALDTTFSHTYLDDDLSRNNWQVGGAVSKRLGDKLTLRARGRHTQRHHFHNAPPQHGNTRGMINLASFDARYKHSDRQTVTGEVVGRYVKSPATATTTTSFYQLKSKVSYLRRLSSKLSADLTGVVKHDWYQQRHTTYTDRNRCDLTWTARSSLTYKLHKCLMLLVDGEYVYNDSNIPTSEYSAGRVGAGIRGIF